MELICKIHNEFYTIGCLICSEVLCKTCSKYDLKHVDHSKAPFKELKKKMCKMHNKRFKICLECEKFGCPSCFALHGSVHLNHTLGFCPIKCPSGDGEVPSNSPGTLSSTLLVFPEIKKKSPFFEIDEEIDNEVYRFDLGRGFEYMSLKQYSKAEEHFISAAENGSVLACIQLSKMKMGMGEGEFRVETNYNQVYNWALVAADGNYPEGEYILAMQYKNGLDRVIDPHPELACQLFKNSAENEYPDSQFEYALCLLNGLGTDQDISASLFYLEKAAQSNHSEACIALGQYHYLKQNTQAAIMWFWNAIDLENSRAFYYLGCCMEFKKLPNYYDAYNFYFRSAMVLEPLAFLRLGELYRMGKGVDKNYIKSRIFYQKAIQLNVVSAIENIRHIDLLEKLSVFGDQPREPIDINNMELLQKYLDEDELALIALPFPSTNQYTAKVYFNKDFNIVVKTHIPLPYSTWVSVKPTVTKPRNIQPPHISNTINYPLPNPPIIYQFDSFDLPPEKLQTEKDQKNMEDFKIRLQYYRNQTLNRDNVLDSCRSLEDQNHPPAIVLVALCFRNLGYGPQYVKYLLRAAKLNYHKAFFYLSLDHFVKCREEIDDKIENAKLALKWGIKGSELGNIECFYTVGSILAHYLVDEASAVLWYDKYVKSTIKGVEDLRFTYSVMANLYAKIGKYNESLNHLHLACSPITANTPIGVRFSLAYYYYYGLGCEVNYQLALYNAERSAIDKQDPTHSSGMFFIGMMYLRGHGVHKNLRLALHCFKEHMKIRPDDKMVEKFILKLKPCTHPFTRESTILKALREMDRDENKTNYIKIQYRNLFPNTSIFIGK
ncbi:hypothetical protein DLAC_05224 [Tieghemostelium lacteum]|uniref:B box-type domain-containing protein n=1 Tax=Tieghemostelium lacteum TaxID=361077 RepID=A0A151ZIP6_TIELA|nr:hypothetical protein DLAC_05224 [Tieghemostelium lacteum]|eukprot:KYQ93826.1 hypothetical protein DLAC_05224 [Tieghemostelium lacteum]